MAETNKKVAIRRDIRRRPFFFMLPALISLAFSLSAFWAVLFPAHFRQTIPDIYRPLAASEAVRSIVARKVLPPHPATILQGYDLGEVVGALKFELQGEQLTDAEAAKRYPAYLSRAAAVLGRNLTLSELFAAKSVAEEMAQSTGLLTKAMGLLSFSRILWMVGGLGTVIFLFPLLRIFLESTGLITVLRSIIVTLFEGLLLRVWKLIWNPRVIPYHPFVFLALFLSWWSHSLTYADPFLRSLMLLAGALGGIFSIFYNIVFGGFKNTSAGIISKTLSSSLLLLAAAYLSQTSWSAYLAFAMTFQALGFAITIFGTAICITFDSDSALKRSLAAAVVCLTVCSGLKIVYPTLVSATADSLMHSQLAEAVLREFTPMGMAVLFGPAQNLSQIVVYFALFFLFIFELDDKRVRRFSHLYLFLFPAALFCGLFVGSVFDQQGLFNTAAVFAVLWVITGVVTQMMESKIFIVPAFGLSLVTWRLAIFLMQNPAVLCAIFEKDRLSKLQKMDFTISAFDKISIGISSVCFAIFALEICARLRPQTAQKKRD